MKDAFTMDEGKEKGYVSTPGKNQRSEKKDYKQYIQPDRALNIASIKSSLLARSGETGCLRTAWGHACRMFEQTAVYPYFH